MANGKFEGENFSISGSPKASERGVVSGEIGVEKADVESADAGGLPEALARIETEESDPLIAALFAHFADEEPQRRIGLMLEEVNKIRRGQEISKERDALLSRFA